MKLLLCSNCGDMLALTRGEVRFCKCLATAGQYLADGLNAEVRGPYVAFGMNTGDIGRQARRVLRGDFPTPYTAESAVEAWVMPRNPDHIHEVEFFTEVEDNEDD